jgi:uncharacterized protein YaaQ
MPKKEDSDSDSDSDSEVFKDPSLQKSKDLQKFTDEPIKIPGGEVLTAEPQATLLVTNLLGLVLKRISDPQLTTNIMDNISKTVELSLEKKKNKINYLKNDKGFKKKNNTFMINSIHNDGTPQPTEVVSNTIKESDDSEEDKKIKGGRLLFFTEQECSFF